MMNILFHLSALFFVFCLYMMLRNQEVFDYRNTVLEKIAKRVDSDIQAGNLNWQWRYDEYDKVGYDAFMRYFWRPVDKFYKNTDFFEK